MVQKKQVKPFFSIVTCTRNSAKFVADCFASIEKQIDQECEHIIVDGASTDGTKKLISEYVSKKHNYPVISISAKPKGIAAAMNEGLKHASGEYIFYLHSDDSFYAPETLAKVHNFLKEHPTLDWAYGQIHEVTGDGKSVGFPPRRKIFQHPHPTLLKFYNYIPHQAAFVKKVVLERFGGFDETLKSMMDDDLWLKLSPHTKWDYMPIVVANYSIRQDSQSESISHTSENTREFEKVQKRYLNDYEVLIAKVINSVIR